MSAQGGTIARGTIHLPMWPVAALLAAMVAAAVGMAVLTDARPDGVVTSVTDSERLANSSAAIREQGAAGLALPAIDAAVLEHSSAAVREQGASIGASIGVTYIHGLENAGAWGIAETTTFVPGLENPGAYANGDAVTAPIEKHGPIEFNGRACPQCR
jgi:hypothetical protein